jgi:hypothetical protein
MGSTRRACRARVRSRSKLVLTNKDRHQASDRELGESLVGRGWFDSLEVLGKIVPPRGCIGGEASEYPSSARPVSCSHAARPSRSGVSSVVNSSR